MTEIEKVIKGLEGVYRCISPVTHTCGDCPYQDNHVECERRVINDAIILLKEQEPTMVIESENMYTGLPITHCPKCGRSLDRYLYGRRQEGEINFCPYCGRGVKWNE